MPEKETGIITQISYLQEFPFCNNQKWDARTQDGLQKRKDDWLTKETGNTDNFI